MMTNDLMDFPPITLEPMPVAGAADADLKTALAAAGRPAQPANTVAVLDMQALALSRFGAWRPAALALIERYRDVAFDLSSGKGVDALTRAIADVRAPRFAAQNVAKASKSELAGISKAIGAEEAAVTALLAPTESRLVALRDAHAERVAAEKAERERIEAERVAAHRAGIAGIRRFLDRCQEPGMTAARIANGIDALAAAVVDASKWEDYADEAANAQRETLEGMRTLHAQVAEHEAEAARLEAQRIEQERKAAELAAQQADMEAAQAKARAEALRVAGIQQRIAEIQAAATGHERATSADLAEARAAVAALGITAEVYAEYAPLAQAARSMTLLALDGLHAAALAGEQQQAQEAAAQAAAQAAAPALPPAPAPLCELTAIPEVTDPGAQEGVAHNPLQPEPVAPSPMGDLAADGAGGGLESAATPPTPAAGGVIGNPPFAAPPAEPTLTLGALNEWLAPVQVSAAGLELLGFPVAGRAKAAKLYHHTDRPAIVAALVKHLQGL